MNTSFESRLQHYSYARHHHDYREKQEDRTQKMHDRAMSVFDVDFDIRTGLVTSYMSVYFSPTTGKPIISNREIFEKGCFSKTIAKLYKTRKQTNEEYLCPYLWAHKEPIGGIKELWEDSRGVVYIGHIYMEMPYAKQAFSSAEQKTAGSSFGFDIVQSWQEKSGGIRHIQEAALLECSLVTRPANPFAQVFKVEVEPVFSRR